MQIETIPVTVDEKEILKNLLEKYNFEFSEWDKRDVNDLGLYGYKYLDHYWTEKERYAYFIKADGKLAGFAMINAYADTDEPVDHGIAEFCIMPKYRRMGVGKAALFQILDRIHGKWHLKMHPRNIGAKSFWINAISEYTKGNYRLCESVSGTEFDDGTPEDQIFFEN